MLMTSRAPQTDDWEEHWDRYASAASRNPAQEMRHTLIAQLFQEGTASSNASVLDLGSGQGDLFVKLRALLPHTRLVGFELSERGVEVSRKKMPGAAFHVADLFHPPAEMNIYKDSATDAVCSEVLEHVDSPVDFIRAARPYLKEGARLIVTVPGGPMSAFDKHIGHRQHFTRQSIAQVLEAAGFRVERVYLAGFPFFNLYRIAVIARGEKLAQDGSSDGNLAAVIAAVAMNVFRFLFRFNFRDSPFGWQVVAVARKVSP